MSTTAIAPAPTTVELSTGPVTNVRPRATWTSILRETQQHPWIGLAVGIAGVAVIAVAGALIGSAMDRSVAGFLLVVPVVLAGVIGGRLIGQVLAALVNFYNPSHIFIGGGVAAIGPMFLAAIRQSVNQRSLALSTRHLEITSAPLGPETGLIGAGVLAMREALRSGSPA